MQHVPRIDSSLPAAAAAAGAPPSHLASSPSLPAGAMAEQDDDPTSWCDEDKAKVYNWVFPAEGAPAPEATAFDEVALGSRGEGDVFDLREQCPPCYRQGKLGSCTANALAFAYEFDEHGLSDERFRPSRLFIYYNERAMEKSIANDKGAQISDGVKTMEKEGVCPENMWPYDIAKFADRPPQTCYEDAQLHKVTHAKSIQQTIPQLKAALVETKRPFVFGFVVYASFETKEVAANGVMPMPAEDEKKLGGHAVAAVGYDDGRQAFIVRNSWGDGWGDGRERKREREKREKEERREKNFTSVSGLQQETQHQQPAAGWSSSPRRQLLFGCCLCPRTDRHASSRGVPAGYLQRAAVYHHWGQLLGRVLGGAEGAARVVGGQGSLRPWHEGGVAPSRQAVLDRA
eukprot:COSAG01_NODE_207_length_22017_cov_118.361164_27_plen_402_part_00